MESIPDMLPMFRRLQVKEEIRTLVQLHIQPHERSIGHAGIITEHCAFPPVRVSRVYKGAVTARGAPAVPADRSKYCRSREVARYHLTTKKWYIRPTFAGVVVAACGTVSLG